MVLKSVLLIGQLFLFFSFLTKITSCDPPPKIEDTPYKIILDSFVVTKYPLTNAKGTRWSNYNENPFPSIQINFQGVYLSFYQDTENLHNVNPRFLHTLDTKGWILGTAKTAEHVYRAYLEHKYFGGEALMATIDSIQLPKGGSPQKAISLNEKFAVTIYYRHQ